jgi:hypothetical protein
MKKEFENISINNNWPKTLVIRNSKGGLIWQVYHVNNDAQAIHITEGAHDNGFESVTLQDYDEDMVETFPNWRMELARQFESLLPDYLHIRKGAIEYPEFDEWDDEPTYDSAGYTEEDRHAAMLQDEQRYDDSLRQNDR